MGKSHASQYANFGSLHMFILRLGDIPFKKIFYWKGRGERRENLGIKNILNAFTTRAFRIFFIWYLLI